MSVLQIQTPEGGVPDRVNVGLAGLPGRLRLGLDGPLRWVDGTAGWTARAGTELRRGARGLLIDRPAPAADLEALRDQAARASAVIAVASPYVLSPTWAACRAALAADRPAAGLLDAVSVVSDPADLDRAVLASLAVVRPLLGGTTLRRAAADLPTTLVTSEGALAVTLTCAVSVRPGLVLTLVGAERRWRVDLPDDGTARPGSAVVADATGSTAVRPVYASSARAAWAGLHAAVVTGAPPPYGLDDLLADVQLFESSSSGAFRIVRPPGGR